MTSRELYRTTFQDMKPSQEAVQKLLCVSAGARRRGNVKLKWIVVFTILVAGAMGCGYAIKAHFTTIQIRDYAYYEELEQYEQAAQEHPEEQLLQIVLPKELGYGFVFVNSTLMDQSVTDDSGNVQDRKMLDVTYAVSGNMAYYEYWGQSEMHLNVGELFEYQQENMEQTKPMDTAQIGDIEVRYMEYKMYRVPPDYELTEEDVKLIEDDNYPIVTGLTVGEKPQLCSITTCYWTMDDKFYELTQDNSRLTAEDWYVIAKTIIDAQ